MLDAPWPPAHDGPQQPRDAHARAWADDAALPVRPPAAWRPAAPPGGAPPHRTDGSAQPQPAHDGGGTRGDGGRAGRSAPEPSADPLRGATWLPEPAWIPHPAPAPEQRWTPEQDWVGAFARRAPEPDAPGRDGAGTAARWLVAGAVAAVVVPLLVLALALGL
ncbi:hypothetical protein [Cellulomonas shaoxiangyii]|uniref:Uncharacterized protein n=1 Tax=Cellulomonas shaoxiangyii TaxID=2566013 RepID=A0A4P7SE42_9CELL|nr:hypothetical protein [Cellulomonas shaoxiangyii]QCB92389.1 hypothetical protein E5225_01295 [Cellulomonas shaoxiangyii]